MILSLSWFLILHENIVDVQSCVSFKCTVRSTFCSHLLVLGFASCHAGMSECRAIVWWLLGTEEGPSFAEWLRGNLQFGRKGDRGSPLVLLLVLELMVPRNRKDFIPEYTSQPQRDHILGARGKRGSFVLQESWVSPVTGWSSFPWAPLKLGQTRF